MVRDVVVLFRSVHTGPRSATVATRLLRIRETDFLRDTANRNAAQEAAFAA
jgi:hypothetical protein